MHMSLWALLAAPLLAGNDLHNMSQATLDLLNNRYVIGIDQDPAAHPVKRTVLGDNTEVWTRELKDGAIANGVFNRDDAQKEVTVSWSKLGASNPSRAKNLWTHQDVSLSGDSYTATVPMHGVVMLRLEKQ